MITDARKPAHDDPRPGSTGTGSFLIWPSAVTLAAPAAIVLLSAYPDEGGKHFYRVALYC